MNPPPALVSPRPASLVRSPGACLFMALLVAAVLSAVETTASTLAAEGLAVCVGVAAYLVGAAGAFAGATGFARGDHLRRAWILIGLASFALAAGRLLWPGELLGLPDTPTTLWLRSAVTVFSNVLNVLGMGLIALTWLRAGLPPPGSPRERIAVGVVLALVAFLVPGPSLVADLQAALRGDPYAGALVLGGACDVAVFLLIAPVFLVARAFSGGSLAWPFGLVAASNLSWLVLDGFELYGSLPGMPPGVGRALTGLLRTLACLLLAAAGITQRLAVRGGAPGEAPA